MSLTYRNYFFSGQYAKVMAWDHDRESIPYIIASHCFRGDHRTARRLYKEYSESFSDQTKIFVHFHLGISYTRTSDYEMAQKLFLSNWKQRHLNGLENLELFYIYQGLSFFRYFFSKHHSSLYFAFKAEAKILKMKSPPALLLSYLYELLAHNYFQLGLATKGALHFQKAIEITKENKLNQLTTEFESSLAVYQSDYSLNLDKSIESLKHKLNHTPESNDYTCSELVLQISKLYLFKGKYKEANQFLLSNFNIIYKNDNKRKVAMLNTLLAQLLLPKHQYIEALSLLRVAKANLDEQIDVNLLIPILGIEIKVLKNLNQDTHLTHEKLNALLGRTDRGVIQQINKRTIENQILPNKEDPIGVLFDQAFLKEVSALDQIIKFQFYHLIPEFFSPLRERKAICIHPKNSGLFFIEEENCHYEEGGLSKNQLKFLSLIKSNPQTKEDLIQKIWGYKEYDPIRHDHLVYTAVRRLRKLLGPYGDWIKSREDQYSLDSDIELLTNISDPNEEHLANNKENEPILELPSDLNFRQVQIIEGVFPGPFSASDVANYFEVSRMTSFRDLDNLVSRGYLAKRGKNRGTKYCLK